MDDLDGIEREKKKWEETTLKKALERSRERREKFETTSGIELDRVKTPYDLRETEYLNDLGFPGQYPFTRGVQPTMYRGRFWTMRQYSGFGTAEETNKRFKYLLEQGQTGLSVAFDLPTQMGYDSDHAFAHGEVGRVGVAIDSLHDMETLLEGIALDKVSTSMTINSTAAILLSMYIALAEKQGVPADRLRGTIQNDLLKEYVARGTYIYPPRASMKIITDIFEFCRDCLPRWNTISISGYHIREAGSTAVQEVAFTLADGIAYVEAALETGLNVDDFAKRLSFFFNVHNNFFEEVAKFRAARRMWARIMRERFEARSDDSCKLRFHTQTAGCTLTAQQPDNNVVRVSLQALAALLGGTQSLHTNSRDEALSLPSEDSVRIALRTQQVIAHESGVADTIDGLAGSYLVESLTDEIEKRAMEYITKIDDMGGMLAAIEDGYVQREIQESAYQYQKQVESGEQVVVGVNRFTIEEGEHMGLLQIDPAIEELQKEKLTRLRGQRDGGKVDESLSKLKEAARDGGNVVPHILECVRRLATLGEISDALREVYGEYKENITV